MASFYEVRLPGNGKYAESFGVNPEYDFTPRALCPVCGQNLSPGYWIHPRQLSLTKRKTPDILACYSAESLFLFSERAIQAMQKHGITGITKIEKTDSVVFQRKSSDPTPPPDYYDLLFVRSRVTINHQESKIKYLHNYVDKPICPVCCPVGRLSHEYYELVYNMEEYEGYDIFHTWERGGTVFVSQKFLDMWKEEKLTGLWYSTAENPKERFTLG